MTQVVDTMTNFFLILNVYNYKWLCDLEYFRSVILDISGVIPDILEGGSGFLKSVIWGILKVAATAAPLFKKTKPKTNV